MPRQSQPSPLRRRSLQPIALVLLLGLSNIADAYTLDALLRLPLEHLLELKISTQPVAVGSALSLGPRSFHHVG